MFAVRAPFAQLSLYETYVYLLSENHDERIQCAPWELLVNTSGVLHVFEISCQHLVSIQKGSYSLLGVINEPCGERASGANEEKYK